MPMQRCPMYVTDQGPCINSTTTPNGWKTSFFIAGGNCAPNASSQIAVLRPVLLPFTGGSATMMLSNGAGVFLHASAAGSGGTGCFIDLTYTTNVASIGVVPVIVAVFYGPTRQILIPVLLDFNKPPNTICPNTSQECTALGDWPESMVPGDTLFNCTR